MIFSTSAASFSSSVNGRAWRSSPRASSTFPCCFRASPRSKRISACRAGSQAPCENRPRPRHTAGGPTTLCRDCGGRQRSRGDLHGPSKMFEGFVLFALSVQGDAQIGMGFREIRGRDSGLFKMRRWPRPSALAWPGRRRERRGSEHLRLDFQRLLKCSMASSIRARPTGPWPALYVPRPASTFPISTEPGAIRTNSTERPPRRWRNRRSRPAPRRSQRPPANITGEQTKILVAPGHHDPNRDGPSQGPYRSDIPLYSRRQPEVAARLPRIGSRSR